jgi:hypothetical protein
MFKSRAKKQAEFLLKVEREKEKLQQREAAREAARQKAAEENQKLFKACVDGYKTSYQRHPKATAISTLVGGMLVLGFGGILTNSSEPSSQLIANPSPSRPPSSSETQTASSGKSSPLATNEFTFPQASCGDKPTGSNDTWYPVFIEGGDLSDIRSRYYADAVSTTRQKTGKSAVQLASFINYDRALEFAQAVDGEVGQSTSPTETNWEKQITTPTMPPASTELPQIEETQTEAEKFQAEVIRATSNWSAKSVVQAEAPEELLQKGRASCEALAAGISPEELAEYTAQQVEPNIRNVTQSYVQGIAKAAKFHVCD